VFVCVCVRACECVCVYKLKFGYKPVARCKPFHQDVAVDAGEVCVCVRVCACV